MKAARMDNDQYFAATQAGDVIAALTRKYQTDSLGLHEIAGKTVEKYVNDEGDVVIRFTDGTYLSLGICHDYDGPAHISTVSRQVDMDDLMDLGDMTAEDLDAYKKARATVVAFQEQSRDNAEFNRLLGKLGVDKIKQMIGA